jgi:hypothetical protein
MALAFWAPKHQPAQKNIRPLEDSYCDFCPATLEMDDYIFLSCLRAVYVWSMLGVEVQVGQHRAPWHLACSFPLPDDVRTDIFLTLLWHIWKATNSKIFEQQTLPPQEVLRQVVQDLDVWTPRYRRSSIYVQAWRDFISSKRP